MKCPICSVDLVMSDRQGVEIDYCPQCRGVWLDRGELDKIIDRSAAEFGDGRGRSDDRGRDYDDYRRDDRDRRYDDRRDYDRDRDRRYDEDYYRKQKKKKRPESFLADLFDFGD